MKTAWWAMFAIAAFGGAIQSGLIFAGLNRQPETGQESSLRTTTFHVWVAVFVLAIGGYVVAYSIWYGLMQRYRVDQVTPFALLMPLVGVLAGAIILGEHLSLWIPSTVDDPGGTAPAKRAGETFVPSLKIKVVASVPVAANHNSIAPAASGGRNTRCRVRTGEDPGRHRLTSLATLMDQTQEGDAEQVGANGRCSHPLGVPKGAP